MYPLKNKPEPRLAFTLVEVLVVASIFSVVGLGITTSIMSAAKLWVRAENVSRNYKDILPALDRISKDLHQGVDVKTIGFEGDTQGCFFPALSDNSILKVTYRFDREKKLFSRTEVKLKYVISGKEDQNQTVKDVLNLDELSIAYLKFNKENKTYNWVSSWTKEDGVFSSIKLSGKYNNETFTKVIFIPAS